MTELEPEYKTETDEAMEMLGVGYDKKQPSVIIQPKRKSIALMDSGLKEYDVWGWVKVSANFINHIQKLSGANLKCWLVIALAIDETGKCKLTIKQLQLLTKLSHTEVISSTKELEEMGYLGIKRNARGNEYEPLFVARGMGNEPVVKKVESTLVDQVDSTPSIEKLHPSIKELKELSGDSSNSKPAKIVGIEASMFAGRKTTDEDINPAKNENDAIVAFEASYGINSKEDASGVLGWYTRKPKWTRLRKFVVEKYLLDKQYFEKYKTWRLTPYTRGAVSIAQVKYDPELFILSCAAFEEVVIVGNQTESPNKFEDGSAYV